jgi:cobalamin biosynthesis protein CobT
MRGHIFQDAAASSTRVIGRKDVRVVFEGDQARTDGETVYLPQIPAAAEVGEADADVIRGFRDHETLHIRCTDMSLLPEIGQAKQDDRFLHDIMQYCEDIRIENAGVQSYPGMQRTLSATNKEAASIIEESITDAGMPVPLAAKMCPTSKAFLITLQALGRRRIGVEGGFYDEFIKHVDPEVVKMAEQFSTEMAGLPTGVVNGTLVSSMSKQHTRDAIDLAKRVHAAYLAQFPPPGQDTPPPPPPPPPGEGEECEDGEPGKPRKGGKPGDKPTKRPTEADGPDDDDEGDDTGSDSDDEEDGDDTDDGDDADDADGDDADGADDDGDDGDEDDGDEGAGDSDSDDDGDGDGDGEDDGDDGDGGQPGTGSGGGEGVSGDNVGGDPGDGPKGNGSNGAGGGGLTYETDYRAALRKIVDELEESAAHELKLEAGVRKNLWRNYSSKLRVKASINEIDPRSYPKNQPRVDSLANYEKARDGIKDKAAMIRRILELELQARFDRTWQPGYKSGRLNSVRLVDAMHGAENVYQKRETGRDMDTLLVLSLDGSSSMDGVKISRAQELAIALAEALERTGADIEVEVWDDSNVGTTAFRNKYGLDNASQVSDRYQQELREFGAAAAPPDALGNVDHVAFRNAMSTRGMYTSLGMLTRRVVKSRRQRMSDPLTRSNMGSIVNMANGGTPMIDAVTETMMDMAKEKHGKKILLVMTDGIPNGSLEHEDYEPHLLQMKFLQRFAQQYGIHLIGVGLHADVSKFFQDYVSVRSSDAYEKVMRKLASHLRDERRARRAA